MMNTIFEKKKGFFLYTFQGFFQGCFYSSLTKEILFMQLYFLPLEISIFIYLLIHMIECDNKILPSDQRTFEKEIQKI